MKGKRSDQAQLIGQRDVTTLADVLQGLRKAVDVRLVDALGDPEDLFVLNQRQWWSGALATDAVLFCQVSLSNEAPAGGFFTVVEKLSFRLSVAGNDVLVNRIEPFAIGIFGSPTGSYRDLQVVQPVGVSSTAFTKLRAGTNAVQQGTSVGVRIPIGGTVAAELDVAVIMPPQTQFVFMPSIAGVNISMFAAGRELEVARR